ncbi:unnamed protein product [Gadus morhua 'NCC']
MVEAARTGKSTKKGWRSDPSQAGEEGVPGVRGDKEGWRTAFESERCRHRDQVLVLEGHMRRGTSSMSGRAELGAVGHLQAELLHLELIDGADGYRGDTESSKVSAVATPTAATKDSATPVTMDTYRPKRPTTLNLFPIVPRTQDTLNNNSFGKKYSWQEKVSRSSSPQKTGEVSPPHEHSCLSDEDKMQGGGAQTKDRGTSTDAPCRHGKAQQKPPAPPPPPQNYTPGPLHPAGAGRAADAAAAEPHPHRERIRYHTADVRLEPTEEIYLTPVQRSADALDPPADKERPFLSQQAEQVRMSVSSDTEGPPPYQPLPDRTDASIHEEDDDLDRRGDRALRHHGDDEDDDEEDQYEDDEVYIPPPSYASCVEALITPPPGHTPAPDLTARAEPGGAGWGAMAVLRGTGVGVEYVDAGDDNYGAGEDEDVDRVMMDGRRRRRRKGGEAGEKGGGAGGKAAPPARTSMSSEASGLSYDSVKYTLVVDEHAQLELVSLRHCYHGYSDDSDSATVYDNCVSSPYESALGEYGEEEEEEEEEEGEEEGVGPEGAREGQGGRPRRASRTSPPPTETSTSPRSSSTSS